MTTETCSMYSVCSEALGDTWCQDQSRQHGFLKLHSDHRMNQSAPYPFSPSQCHHKTWHMSQTVRHNHVKAAQIKHTHALKSLYAQANRKDSRGCWQTRVHIFSPLAAQYCSRRGFGSVPFARLCLWWAQTYSILEHQIILLLSENNWGTLQPWRFRNMNEFNIQKRLLFFYSILAELYVSMRTNLKPCVLERRAHYPLCGHVIPCTLLIPEPQGEWQRPVAHRRSSVLGRLNTDRPLHPGSPAVNRRIMIPAWKLSVWLTSRRTLHMITSLTTFSSLTE